MNKRKDDKGRLLKTGESQRKDKTYMFRWADYKGIRHCIYDLTLSGLREKEAEIEKEMQVGIARSDITLNEQIELYLSGRSNLKVSTMENYLYYYRHTIKDSRIGRMKIREIRKSHILSFYSEVKKKGISNGTIAILQKIIHPAFGLAVDDEILNKNPSQGCLKDYADNPEKKFALTFEQENEFLERVWMSARMRRLYPLFALMLRTGLRIGEVLGLTWNDVDLEQKTININHQLLYRSAQGRSHMYCEDTTKTSSGKRILPIDEDICQMLYQVYEKWEKEKAQRTYCLDGFSNFVFISNYSKDGRAIYPGNIRRDMERIVAHNKERTVQIPNISPHILRHTTCTRMAESGMDLKTIQYMMGHSDIKTTVRVYDHVDMERLKRELSKYQDLHHFYTISQPICKNL